MMSCTCAPACSRIRPESRVRTMEHESPISSTPQISQPEGEGYCIVLRLRDPMPGKTSFLVADNLGAFSPTAPRARSPTGASKITGHAPH